MKTNLLESVKTDEKLIELSEKWNFKPAQCEKFSRPSAIPEFENGDIFQVDISDPVMAYTSNWRNFKTVDVEKAIAPGILNHWKYPAKC